MKMLVLAYDGLKKACVVDPKTLDIYETYITKNDDKKDTNIYNSRCNRILSITSYILSVCLVNIVMWLCNMTKVEIPMFCFYLIVVLICLESVLVPCLRVEVDFINLNSVSKTKQRVEITNAVEIALVNEKKNYQCIFIALILSLIIMLLCFILNDFSHFDTGNALFITSILLLFPNRSITRRKTLKKLLAELEEMA